MVIHGLHPVTLLVTVFYVKVNSLIDSKDLLCNQGWPLCYHDRL